MQRLIRSRNAPEVISLVKDIIPGDHALENPRIQALLGQAYSAMGADCREQAREAFKRAEGVGYKDIFMLRSWFHMEFTSGYGLAEAERICLGVLNDPKFGQRYKSEFWSKFGSCLFQRAVAIIGASREKAIGLLKESISAYMEAIYIAQFTKEIADSEPLAWIEKPLQRFVAVVGGDVEEFFRLLEAQIEKKHDIALSGAQVVLGYLTRSKAPADKRTRDKVKGLCERTVGKINRSMRPLSKHPGFEYIVMTLETFIEHLSDMEAVQQATPQN